MCSKVTFTKDRNDINTTNIWFKQSFRQFPSNKSSKNPLAIMIKIIVSVLSIVAAATAGGTPYSYSTVIPGSSYSFSSGGVVGAALPAAGYASGLGLAGAGYSGLGYGGGYAGGLGYAAAPVVTGHSGYASGLGLAGAARYSSGLGLAGVSGYSGLGLAGAGYSGLGYAGGLAGYAGGYAAAPVVTGHSGYASGLGLAGTARYSSGLGLGGVSGYATGLGGYAAAPALRSGLGYGGGYASGLGYAAPALRSVVAAPAVYSAPAVVKTIAPEPFDPHPQYNYGYSVSDGITGDQKSHSESRDGDVVRGQYSLVEADGAIRTVTYSADGINGFNAVVDRSAPTIAVKQVVQAAPVAVGYKTHGQYL